MTKLRMILYPLLLVALITSALLSKENKPVQSKFDINSVFVPTNNTYPALVRLTVDGRTFCSATVLTKKIVLTAAHCILVPNPIMGYEFIKDAKIQSLPGLDKSVISVDTKVIAANQRADYALLKGDFSKFSTLIADDRPSSDILYHQYNLYSCGFPYGGTGTCYQLTNPTKFIDAIRMNGQMIAGMSGGPVIDANTGYIYAVNTGVMETGVVISPIINIFELLSGK